MPPKGKKKGGEKSNEGEESAPKSSNGQNHENIEKKNEPKEEASEDDVEKETVKDKGKGKGRAKKQNKNDEPKDANIEKSEDGKDDENDEDEEKKTAKRPTRGAKRTATSDDEEPSSKRTKGDSTKSNFACEKTTPDGLSSNLKISCWNVAGLRAWIKKEGSLDYVIHQEQPDIMILLETKCADNKLPPEVKIPDYLMYTVTSEKEGYCGVMLYSKIKPLNVQYGIGNQEFDHEGRCIIAEYKDFYLVCTYVPNAGQGLKTLPKKLKWNVEFLKLLKNLDEKKPVILCGDLNVAHEPIDLANPKTNTKNAGFTKEEREDFTKLLKEGFVDTFRHFYPDETGAYTFWSNRGGARSRNVGWRLDYFVVSNRFVSSVCDSLIRSEILGSDHCPITLCLHV